MLETIRAHLARNAIAYLALFVALTSGSYAAVKVGSGQVADNSLRSVDIKNRGIKGIDVAKRTLRAENFQAGALPAGAQGPAGATGAAGPRGPSFGGGIKVGNLDNFPCSTDVTVASLPLTLTQPARLWANAHGTLRRGNAVTAEYGLWTRLRDSAGTVIASTIPGWGRIELQATGVLFLSSAGVMVSGDRSETPQSVAVVAAGTYTLELATLALGGVCVADLPDFGQNGGAQLSYVVLGTG